MRLSGVTMPGRCAVEAPPSGGAMRLRPVLAATAAAALASLAWAGAVAPSAGAAPAASAQPSARHVERVCAQVVTGAACGPLRLDPPPPPPRPTPPPPPPP